MTLLRCSNRKCGPYKNHSFIWRGKNYCSPWCAKNDGREPQGMKQQIFKERKPKKA